MTVSLHSPPPLTELLAETDLKLLLQPLSKRLEAEFAVAVPSQPEAPIIFENGKRITSKKQLGLIRSAAEAIGFLGDRPMSRFSADKRTYTFRPIRCANEILGLFGYRPLKKPRPGQAADDTFVLSLIEGTLDSRFRVFLTSQMHIAMTEENYRELEKNYAQLIEAQRRLQRLDELKSDFVANVNHELRTPLTAVLGFTELLLAEKDKLLPDHLECVEQIHEKSTHLIRMINRVLAFSEIEAQRQTLLKTIFDLGPLVKEVVENLTPFSSERDVKVVAETTGNPLPVDGDRDKIGLVLDDLIQNAIKFSPSGRTVTVRIYSEGKTDTTKNQFLALAGQGVVSTYIDVTDEGPGMSFDQVPEIFVDFHQIDSGSTRQHGGLGLGLPLAKRMVELHGGSLTVRTEPGKGSTFTIRLPASARLAGEVREIGRVLVIEDDPSTATVMRQFIEAEGGSFENAPDGESGIRAAERHLPEIVLLDLKLPDTSGVNVARRLTQSGVTSGIPIVAVTAVSDLAEHGLALEAGCKAVVVKPFTRDRLIEVIRKYALPKKSDKKPARGR